MGKASAFGPQVERRGVRDSQGVDVAEDVVDWALVDSRLIVHCGSNAFDVCVATEQGL